MRTLKMNVFRVLSFGEGIVEVEKDKLKD